MLGLGNIMLVIFFFFFENVNQITLLLCRKPFSGLQICFPCDPDLWSWPILLGWFHLSSPLPPHLMQPFYCNSVTTGLLPVLEGSFCLRPLLCSCLWLSLWLASSLSKVSSLYTQHPPPLKFYTPTMDYFICLLGWCLIWARVQVHWGVCLCLTQYSLLNVHLKAWHTEGTQ